MKNILILLACLSGLSLTAQKYYDFGDVFPNDLSMTVYDKDSTAEAVVLFDLGDMEIYRGDGSSRLERHVRIKILKESALNRGTMSLIFQSSDNYEAITKVEAQTILPSGEIFPVDKKEFFEEDYNEYFSAINFAFPNVQVGAILEYKYTLIENNVVIPPEWYFQRDIPVRLSRLKVNFPELFSYIYLFQGAEYLQEKEDGTYLFNGVASVKLGDGLFQMKNVPAFKEEPFMTCEEDYRARVRFQLQEVYGKRTDGIEGYYVEQKILPSWEEIANTMYMHTNFGQQYRQKKNYKDLQAAVEPLLTGVSDEREKANIIYTYLAENIETRDALGIFADQKLDKSFALKRALPAEVNMMLLALLNRNGIEAYPVLTSTRSHGQLLPKHPMVRQFNYLLVQASLNGEAVMMDVRSRLHPMGYPWSNALNYKGWLIKDQKTYEWIDIEAPMSTQTIAINATIEETDLKATVKVKSDGYYAINERAELLRKPSGKFWEERIADYLDNSAATDQFEAKNDETVEAPFYNNFEVVVEDHILENEDYLYITPVLHGLPQENVFKSAQRYYPVDFPYPTTFKYIFSLKIPEGYEVETLPEGANISLQQKRIAFKYMASSAQGNVQLIAQFKINASRVSHFQYPNLKVLYDLIVEKQSEPIVLKKINH